MLQRSFASGNTSGIAPIAASRFLSLFSIGIGFVTVVWLANIADSIRLVGQIFFASSLATLAVSVVAGAIADQRSRLRSLRWAWLLRFAAILALIIGISVKSWLVPCLFAHNILTAFGNSLGGGAMDSAFQGAIPHDRRADWAVRLEVVRQLGLVGGMGVSGYLLHWFGAIIPALLLLVCFLTQMVLFEVQLRQYVTLPAPATKSILRFWFEGARSAWQNKGLLSSMLAAALLSSVAQMTNLLVPAFVKNTLQRDSELYGLLESAWSFGGGALLILVSIQKKPAGKGQPEFVLIAAIGALMIVFATTRSIPLLVLFYAVLGGLFSLARALCDGRLLSLAGHDEIGRVRSAAVMMTSLTGMVIFLLPSWLQSEDAVLYYVIWGNVVAVLGVVAYFWSKTSEQKTPAS